MGTHQCNRRQFCVNSLGSYYCVNHTVLCAEGFILNRHRKCVGKPAPACARHGLQPAVATPATDGHMLKGLNPLHLSPHVLCVPVSCPAFPPVHQATAFSGDRREG